MAYGELYMPPEVTYINSSNGRFLPGHVPANKGKKWNEWAGKRAQKRMMKGWKNLDKYRPTTRPDSAGRNKKPVIGIFPDGSWQFYPSMAIAAEVCGVLRENIRRCCVLNAMRHINKKTGKVNTDHQYKSIRWYFEDDHWTNKIQQQ